MEKQHRKRVEGESIDRKIDRDALHEKFNTVTKRREILRVEFDQLLRKKEEHYKQRM